MARLSPITIGILVVTSLVLGLTVYLISNSRRATETAVVPDPTDAWPPGPSQQKLPVAFRPARDPMPALPQVPTVESPRIFTQEQTVAAAPAPAGAVGLILQKRALLNVSHHQQLTRDADERVFETLRMPEAQRAAVRQINEDFANRLRQLLNTTPGGVPAIEKQFGLQLAKNTDADRARWAALEDLLGADAARVFDTNERSAARILLRGYRVHWARELQEQAPLPQNPTPP